MDPTIVIDYATEGAPLLIADLPSAAHWRGREDDGSGVTVQYMGHGIEKFPKELRQTVKPGRQPKKFGSLDEARIFEAKVLQALKKMHPTAERHPRFPNQATYYNGSTRVYSVEIKFTSMFDTMLLALKSSAQILAFGAKKRAPAILMQQQGAGRGLISADVGEGTVVIVKLHNGAPTDRSAAVSELAALPSAKPKGKVHLDGNLLIVDSAQSQREIAPRRAKDSRLGPGCWSI